MWSVSSVGTVGWVLGCRDDQNGIIVAELPDFDTDDRLLVRLLEAPEKLFRFCLDDLGPSALRGAGVCRVLSELR